jgi:hypothetical protein
LPLGAAARDQIDALRAAADLLVRAENPWIAVTGDYTEPESDKAKLRDGGTLPACGCKLPGYCR